MSYTMQQISLFLFILLLNGIAQIEASNSSDVGKFFSRMGNKISKAATKFKEYLLEIFYRFHAFFMGHSESTHNLVTARGCGYAADDEPTIYNKQAAVVAKIKGGDDAIWHTW